MARAITKTGTESIIYAFVIDDMDTLPDTKTTKVVDDDNNEIEIEYTHCFIVRGNKSDNAAQILTEKKYGKNSMVVYVAKRNASKLTLDADTFIRYSKKCEEGKSYGHDYVTSEFKVTYVAIKYRAKDGMHDDVLIYNGETTDSKLLNFARAYTKSKMCIIKNKVVDTERRYMTRAQYEELATTITTNDGDES